MAQQSTVRNPFMLMLQPEVVLAAMERSERLGKLNRHLCRPLDRSSGPIMPSALDDSIAEEAESSPPEPH